MAETILPITVTRRCEHCREDKTESYYSIYISGRRINFRTRERLTCNECMIKQTFRRMFLATDLQWQDEGSCAKTGVPSAVFFPASELERRQEAWTPFCASCPVTSQCRKFGETTRSTGIFGGVYLTDGVQAESAPTLKSEYKPGRSIPPKQKAALQQQLVKMVDQGVSTAEMARELGISTFTVKRWRKALDLVS